MVNRTETKTVTSASKLDENYKTGVAVEVDILFDVTFQSGTAILKIKLHVLSDVQTGITRTGLNSLELYETDSDDYAVIEKWERFRSNH